MKTISSLYYSTKDLFVNRSNKITEDEIELECQGFEEYLTDIEKENKRLKCLYDDLIRENGCMDKHIKELETDLEDYYKMQDKQQEQLEDSMLYGEDNPYYLEKYSPKLYKEILRNQELERVNETLWQEQSEINTRNLNLAGENFNLETKIKKLEEENGELKTENTYLKNYNEMLENANLNMYLKETLLENRIEELSQLQETKEILDQDNSLVSNELLIDRIDKLEDKAETYKEVINTMCDRFNIPHNAVKDIVENIQSSKDQQLEKTL